MKCFLTLVIAAVVAYSGAVSAQDPTLNRITVTREIAAAPDKVWALIGNFQDMSWHPAVANTEGQGGNTPGATRTLTLGNGGKIHEKLEKYDADEHSLFYRIEQVDVKVLPVTNYSSWLSVKPTDNGGSLATWKGAFYRGDPNDDPPPELNDEAAIKAMTGVYEAGLDNAKTLAEGD